MTPTTVYLVKKHKVPSAAWYPVLAVLIVVILGVAAWKQPTSFLPWFNLTASFLVLCSNGFWIYQQRTWGFPRIEAHGTSLRIKPVRLGAPTNVSADSIRQIRMTPSHAVIDWADEQSDRRLRIPLKTYARRKSAKQLLQNFAEASQVRFEEA